MRFAEIAEAGRLVGAERDRLGEQPDRLVPAPGLHREHAKQVHGRGGVGRTTGPRRRRCSAVPLRPAAGARASATADLPRSSSKHGVAQPRRPARRRRASLRDRADVAGGRHRRTACTARAQGRMVMAGHLELRWLRPPDDAGRAAGAQPAAQIVAERLRNPYRRRAADCRRRRRPFGAFRGRPWPSASSTRSPGWAPSAPGRARRRAWAPAPAGPSAP